MAEKGFGVKEVNLIGASGTPTITSPNNLNLNANNVAISTNVSIGGTLTVTGNVSVGGTLTYEDVTNIDSVGLITARNGLIVTGVTTTGGITIKAPTSNSVLIGQDAGANWSGAQQCVGVGYYALQSNTNSNFCTAVGTQALGALGSNSGSSYTGNTAVGHLAGYTMTTGSGNTLLGRIAGSLINSSNNTILGIFDGNSGGLDIRSSSSNVVIADGNGSVRFYANSSGNVGLNSIAPTSKLDVGGNVKVTGIVTATTFSGSGASLTSLPAGNLTGTVADARISTLTASKLSGALPAISGANLTNIPAPVESPVVNFTVTANGSSAYRFSGGGVDDTADDPDLYLIRGQTYRFNNTTGSAHPFQFRATTGGSAYTAGITGDQNGVQFFTPDNDTPSKIYYICTLHSSMVGTIYIRGANGANENVGVTTFSGLIHLKSGVPAIFLEDTDGTHGQGIIEQNGDDLKIRQDAGNASSGTGSNIRFETDATERLRIRSNNGDILFGNYLGGGTNQPRVYFLSEDGDFPDQTNSLGLRISNGYSDASIRLYSNSNNWNHVKFYSTHTGSIVTAGSISQSGGNTISYNTSSDYRLKENEVAISDGITRLKQLKPYRFNFKTNTSKIVDGFFAHEVSGIVPEAITGEKDGVVTQTMIDAGEIDEAIGTPVYQQIDQAKLVPVLTAALQEAISKIETLEAKVAALEGS